jgi:hypothetical protein
MRFAYADPPYPGCAHYYLKENPNASEVDHAALISRLVSDYPDGWALSTHSPALRDLLPLCPPGTRVAAWCKPFAAWKIPKNEDGKAAAAPFAWEPVIYFTTSRAERAERAERRGVFCRDFLMESPPMKQRVPGEKPLRFSWWMFSLLGASPGDQMDDLFPGSGAVSEAWRSWCDEWDTQGTLFAVDASSGEV